MKVYIPERDLVIEHESERYVHPVTGEVYGRTDYFDPQKMSEIGGIPLVVSDDPHVEGDVVSGSRIVVNDEGTSAERITEYTTPEPPPPPPLPAIEEILENTITMIDLRTHEIITSGFTWNAMTISSSEAAQSNFLAIEQIRQRGSLTFPLPWSTKDGAGLLIATEEEWLDLLTAKDTFVFFTAKQSGQQLRDMVSSLTVEELILWTDPRSGN